ncbi:glycosyltransferase family 47 protein [Polynucleobacter sp. MWH-UH2A]|uniref:glycosyltransferase family 47 protein n=1 Tax=Polynucleobacter sp. MWH-UH2A TaxID=1855617 RepID=UPI001BFD4B8F|nr:glycosyltransferase family 47 protein [Polynucleobacter sp. MWH-UH2A]QWD64186.1 hypothetical protein IC571_00700 [Polynucleobacter sp. MWH-UH2A]
MSQVNIILIHLGSGELPMHLIESIKILVRIASRSKIHLLINRSNAQSFSHTSILNKINLIFVEDINESVETKAFSALTTLDKKFRDGFWFNASNRFHVLADYINQHSICNVLHLENDYVIYFDPSNYLSSFEGYSEFSVPLDRVRAIPGVVWIKNPAVAKDLSRHLLENPANNDMLNLGEFVRKYKYAKPLPTIPPQLVRSYGADFKRYAQGYEIFHGIFDAAAIGQYIGGVHWLNNPNDTLFFSNESSDLRMEDAHFTWGASSGVRSPFLTIDQDLIPILGVHAHSKDLNGVSPFNSGVPDSIESIVTGEKIQSIADLTIATKEIVDFHGRENIKSRDLIILDQDHAGNFLFPSEKVINEISKNKILFVYTHLIPFFKKYIAPRLKYDFILISHNSDHSVTINDLGLLNNPALIAWFAQNCEFAHEKLKSIPIGLENKQWGAGKTNQIFSVAKNNLHRRLVYLNFSINTHIARLKAFNICSKIPGVTIESGLDYGEYLKNLANHKFAICPRGNGIDTHRFWECQYLGVIPIILKSDWTGSYSDYPVLIVESWENLTGLDLEKMYIRIANKSFTRFSLNMNNISKAIIESCVL